jgi:hypothetical protein
MTNFRDPRFSAMYSGVKTALFPCAKAVWPSDETSTDKATASVNFPSKQLLFFSFITHSSADHEGGLSVL